MEKLKVVHFLQPEKVSYTTVLTEFYKKFEEYNVENLIVYSNPDIEYDLKSASLNILKMNYDNSKEDDKKFIHIINDFKPDIFHTRQSANIIRIVYDLQRKLCVRVPIVSTLDIFELYFTQRKNLNDAKKIYGDYCLADIILCTQEDMFKNVKKANLFDMNKIRIDRNSINTSLYEYNEEERIEKRKELGLKENDIGFLFMARTCFQKGIYDLIDAFELFLDKVEDKERYKLFVFGGNIFNKVSENDVIEVINNFKYRDNIKNMGYVLDSRPYFKAFDVFFNPNVTGETFCYSLVQAMASKLAVIVSDVEYPKIILDYGKYGLVHKGGNFYELKDKMFEILKKLDYYKKMAYKRSKNYDYKYTMPNLIRIYKKLVGK